MRIGIIGCGVSGQAAAIAFSRDGHDVTVVERFAQARPLGAGLLLQPSGLAALARLGLRETIESWGAKVERLDGRTSRGRKVLDLHYKGECGLGIHRTALFNALHGALVQTTVRIELGFDIARTDGVSLFTADSRSVGPFDLIVDCAGAHDALRRTFSSRVHDPIYPWGAFWTTCEDKTGEFGGALRQVYQHCSKMIGILPVGRVPGAASGGNHVAFFWSLPIAEYDAQKAEGLNALKRKVIALWPAAEPIVSQIQKFEDLSFATYRDVAMKPWRSGRVIAIGDAAHGTSPQLGQGANLSLIDAVTLAHCLRKTTNSDEALHLYERLRRPHITYYRIASCGLTPFFQSNSRVIAWLRDTFMGPSRFLPGVDYVMRTTLSGVRKWPWDLWTLPD